jgi:hypothetical protein
MPTTNAKVLSRGLRAGKVILREEEEEESNLLGCLPRPPCTLSKLRAKSLEKFFVPMMPQMYVYVMYMSVYVYVMYRVYVCEVARQGSFVFAAPDVCVYICNVRVCVCVCVYIYIYVYAYTLHTQGKPGGRTPPVTWSSRGGMGESKRGREFSIDVRRENINFRSSEATTPKTSPGFGPLALGILESQVFVYVYICICVCVCV